MAGDERSALDIDQTIVGCVIANELVDAFLGSPGRRPRRSTRRTVRGLSDDGERFVFVEDAVDAEARRVLRGPGRPPWRLHRGGRAGLGRASGGEPGPGALLVLDYGYPAAELYAPRRRHGTLLSYRGHTLASDPLSHVGQQDVTSHVDFTALARACARAALTTIGPLTSPGS